MVSHYPGKPNAGDFVGVCSSGVCFPPSGSKSDALLLKTGSPRAHCYRHVLVFNMSHVCHLVPSVAFLTIMELFKAGAVKQNEIVLSKESVYNCTSLEVSDNS